MKIHALGAQEYFIVKTMHDDRFDVFAKCEDCPEDSRIKEFSQKIGTAAEWSPLKRKWQKYLRIRIPVLKQDFYMDLRVQRKPIHQPAPFIAA